MRGVSPYMIVTALARGLGADRSPEWLPYRVSHKQPKRAWWGARWERP